MKLFYTVVIAYKQREYSICTISELPFTHSANTLSIGHPPKDELFFQSTQNRDQSSPNTFSIFVLWQG